MVQLVMRFGCSIFLSVLLGSGACAQKSEPANVYLFPAGGQRGTRVDAALLGENVSTLCDFHLQRGAGFSLRMAPPQARDRRVNLSIAPDAPLGPVMWRIATAQGGTGSRAFVIGEHPEIIESEPGVDDPAPQPVKLPVTVNGRLNPDGDVDRFSFELRGGQPFSAEVMAARLGGPIDTNCFSGQFGNPPDDPSYKQLDATLELYAPGGRLLMQAEDTFGLDPALGFVAPADGRYVIAVRHMAHAGMPQFVYRLTLASVPLVVSAVPAPGLRAVEREPNDLPADAMPVSAPATLNGRFGKPGDVDLYRLTLRKGEPMRFEAWGERLGSPTEASLAVLDPAGKELASSSGGLQWTRDPLLFFTAPADGEYLLRIREAAMSRSSERLVYRLLAAPQPPEFSLTLAAEFVDTQPGSAADLEVTVRRLGGFAGAVQVTVGNLPTGVSAAPLEIKAGQDKGKLRLTAAAGCASGSWPVKVIGKSRIGDSDIVRAAEAPVANPAETALHSAPRTVEEVLLTVRFPAPFKVEADDSYLFVNLGMVHPARITIERDPGFTGPLLLTMADRQPRNPYGITFAPLTLTGSAAEAFFPMRLPQGPRGNEIARVHIKAEAVVQDKDGREWHVLRTSVKQCVSRCIAPVLSLSVEPDAQRATPGAPVSIRFRLGRTAASMGPAEIRLLPDERVTGISLEPLQVPAGQMDVMGVLQVAPGAALGRASELWFEVTSRRDNGQTVFYQVPLMFDLRPNTRKANARPAR